MSLVFGPSDAFFTIRVEDPQFTDGYALVTGGLTGVDSISPALAQSLFNGYADAWASSMWSSSVITECQVYNETQAATYTGSVVGTGVGVGNMAVNCALLIEKAASGRGRRNRGRNFLPSLLFEGTTFGDGSLDAGFVDAMESNLADWFVDVIDAGVAMAIPQGEQKPRKDGSPGSPPIIPWPQVETVAVDSKIATQRRRLRR